MHCPQLEETSALFDGHAGEDARTHATECAECTAFLTDATQLRACFREGSDPAFWGLTPPPVRPRPRLAIPAFALAAMVIAVLWIARPRPRVDTGVFAGLDGGGRATITVKEVAR